jgi:hypothetical protein
MCERVYFDQITIMRQLGLAHDSRSFAGRLTTLVSHPLTSAAHWRAGPRALGHDSRPLTTARQRDSGQAGRRSDAYP